MNMSNKTGGAWYWIPTKTADVPQKVSFNGVLAGLRNCLALSTDEARRHMADHASGKSPAIGLPNGGFYQWERS